jgi:hypothetical protein
MNYRLGRFRTSITRQIHYFLTIAFRRRSMTVGEVLTLLGPHPLTGRVVVNGKLTKIGNRFYDMAPITGPVSIVVSYTPALTDFVVVTGCGDPESDFRLDIVSSMIDAGLSGFAGVVYEFDTEGLPS